LVFDPSEVVRPSDLQEALDALDSNSKIVAGNTNLYYLTRRGKLEQVTKLVDISRLGISYVREKEGTQRAENRIFVGAGTTFRELISSPISNKTEYLGLKEALNLNPPQIRNVATIGGSICSAVSFYDVPVMLMALDSTLNFLSKNREEHLVPIESYFQNPSRFENSILVECQLPSTPNSGSSFVKLCRRMSGYAIAMAAVKVRLDQNSRKIQGIQIAVGAMTAVPQRLKQVEAALRNKEPTVENITRSCEESADDIRDPVPSVHASIEYKKQVLPSLLRDAITSSVERAQEDNGEKQC
jgi:CO/xanthine dehydrogenase FAD-binding subunit